MDMHVKKRRNKIAIVGGGPGGLFTALSINQERPDLDVTIFEASDRFGGKVITGVMQRSGVRYDAGAAELYDYSSLGEDPLKDLVEDLGLETMPVSGKVFFFDGQKIDGDAEIRARLGERARRQIASYTERCRTLFSPESYYAEDLRSPEALASAVQTYEEFLSTIEDLTARRYVETMAHSDVATEPHLTSAMYGIHNWLMNFPEYMTLYTVHGGLEKVVEKVIEKITANFIFNRRIDTVRQLPDGRYRLETRHRPLATPLDFDAVVVALPINHLTQLRFEDPALRTAIGRHLSHYDNPAHYLRVTMTFDRAFWRDHVEGDYFFLDAFGGCCVYDMSEKTFGQSVPTLGWLLSGAAALTLGNSSDEEIVRLMLASLPNPIGGQRAQPIESAVHRWAGSVNGWPMGREIAPEAERHRPDVVRHPNFYVVGDYLYDSTLNGVIESAQFVADLLSESTITR